VLWICSNLRNNFWKKWGGQVHHSPCCGDAPFTLVVMHHAARQARHSTSRLSCAKMHGLDSMSCHDVPSGIWVLTAILWSSYAHFSSDANLCKLSLRPKYNFNQSSHRFSLCLDARNSSLPCIFKHIFTSTLLVTVWISSATPDLLLIQKNLFC